MPNSYWVRLSSEQLWKWMDVVCAMRNIKDQPVMLASVVHLYGYAPVLFKKEGVKGEAGCNLTDHIMTDWDKYDNFVLVERAFREKVDLAAENCLSFIKWCILRIELHEQAQSAIKRMTKNKREEAKL